MTAARRTVDVSRDVASGVPFSECHTVGKRKPIPAKGLVEPCTRWKIARLLHPFIIGPLPMLTVRNISPVSSVLPPCREAKARLALSTAWGFEVVPEARQRLTLTGRRTTEIHLDGVPVPEVRHVR